MVVKSSPSEKLISSTPKARKSWSKRTKWTKLLPSRSGNLGASWVQNWRRMGPYSGSLRGKGNRISET